MVQCRLKYLEQSGIEFFLSLKVSHRLNFSRTDRYYLIVNQFIKQLNISSEKIYKYCILLKKNLNTRFLVLKFNKLHFTQQTIELNLVIKAHAQVVFVKGFGLRELTFNAFVKPKIVVNYPYF